MRLSSCCFIVTAIMLLHDSASADDPVRKIDPSQPVGTNVTLATPHGAAVITPQANDQRIVRWLTVDNRAVADCARLAADHAASAEVKQFAADVAKDHEDFAGTFGAQSNAPANDAAAKAVDRPTDAATLLHDEGASRAGAMIYRPTDFVAVKEQICKSMADIAHKQMEALPPQEFDRAFLAHMVFGHHALIASIDALNNTASPDLRPQLAKMREMLAKHLNRAGELQKQINTPTTASRPETNDVK